MKIDLTKEELEMIIDWFHIADTYFEERGVDMLKKEIDLVQKLEELTK